MALDGMSRLSETRINWEPGPFCKARSSSVFSAETSRMAAMTVVSSLAR